MYHVVQGDRNDGCVRCLSGGRNVKRTASDQSQPGAHRATHEETFSPEQAIGGSSAIFGLAKTRLKPEEFLKVSDAVPGMDGLLKAAPQPKQQGTDPFSSVTSALPGSAKSLSSLTGAFSQLGLSPDMARKFVPVLTDFVKKKGGKDVAKILSGAFK